MITLHIGIVLYKNPLADLSRLLHSIRITSQKIENNNLIVINFTDNDPDEKNTNQYQQKSKEVLRDINYHWHKGYGNIGFGKAHNFMMNKVFEADATHYLCLNPDGFLHFDALPRALNIIKMKEKKIYEMRQLPNEHPKDYNAKTGETDWVSGACMLVSKALYDEIGGFDENIFMYCEDVDYSWRAKLAGYQCHIMDNSYFFHDVVSRVRSLVRERQMFLEARYLGYKWGALDFVEEVEKILQEKKYFGDRKFFPRLKEEWRVFEKVPEDIANFRNLLTFARARWVL